MSSISETATYANQDRPSGTGCRENWPQDQQRKDQGHENQQQTAGEDQAERCGTGGRS